MPLIRKHIRMHQTAGKSSTQPLCLHTAQPGAIADQALNIEFETGLDERKIAGTQTHRHIALEDSAQQRLHEVDQVRDRDFAIDHHAFQLIEGMLVRGVHFFVAKRAPGSNHAQRRPELSHAAHLNRRSMRAQQKTVRSARTCPACRAPDEWRDIQRVEIVFFGLDFRAVQNRKAKRRKQVFDFLLHLRDRMQAARPDARRRKRDVDPLSREPLGQCALFEAVLLAFVLAFEILLDRS